MSYAGREYSTFCVQGIDIGPMMEQLTSPYMIQIIPVLKEY